MKKNKKKKKKKKKEKEEEEERKKEEEEEEEEEKKKEEEEEEEEEDYKKWHIENVNYNMFRKPDSPWSSLSHECGSRSAWLPERRRQKTTDASHPWW